jgi:hypothetical protein
MDKVPLKFKEPEVPQINEVDESIPTFEQNNICCMFVSRSTLGKKGEQALESSEGE